MQLNHYWVLCAQGGVTGLSELIKNKTSCFVKNQFLGIPDMEKPLLKIYDICEGSNTLG